MRSSLIAAGVERTDVNELPQAAGARTAVHGLTFRNSRFSRAPFFQCALVAGAGAMLFRASANPFSTCNASDNA